MKFFDPKEPLNIKILSLSPLPEMWSRVPTVDYYVCGGGPRPCPACWMNAEAKYREVEMGRWADDGGRV